MQKLKLYLQLSALFAIMNTHIFIKTQNLTSQEVDQLYRMAEQKARIHEPPSIITSQDQKKFPKKKHELLSNRIGIIDEKVQRLSSDTNKKKAIENLNQRVEKLKNYYGIESDIHPRLLMAPLERARYDQETLDNLRGRLVMVKKKLALEQKYFESTKKNLSSDTKKEKKIMLARWSTQLTNAQRQLTERKKLLFDLNKKISKDSKRKRSIEKQQQTAYNATQKKKYHDTQKQLAQQKQLLKKEQTALASSKHKLQKESNTLKNTIITFLSNGLSNAKKLLKKENRDLGLINKKVKIAQNKKTELEKNNTHKHHLSTTSSQKQNSLKNKRRNLKLTQRQSYREEKKKKRLAHRQSKSKQIRTPERRLHIHPVQPKFKLRKRRIIA